MSDLTAPPGTEDGWRIDELARRSGLSVDTIRYYQREGLLAPPRRQGRTAAYGARHLQRLEQIRDLQARHLSLAAIKGLLSGPQAALAATLFAAGDGDYTRAQLCERTGHGADLVDELEESGVLQPPASLGRHSYDEADVRLLMAVRRLLELGMPRSVVVRLGAIYTRGFARMQAEVYDLFVRGGSEDLGVDLVALQDHLTRQVSAVLGPVGGLLDYRHHRTLQLLTLSATARYEDPVSPPAPAPGR